MASGYNSGEGTSSALRAPREQGRGIVVIGAGIVGICAAAYLAEAGYAVTVLDRTGICEETSSGNAAAFAFSDVMPLAQKGMLRQVPRWLLDPLGPLSIPPAYLLRLAPWLWRFMRAGGPVHRETALAAQVRLMQLARTEWEALMQRSGTGTMLREGGSLELYESEAEFEAALPGWAARERFGIDFRHLGADEIPALQPGLSPRFVRATFVPEWKTVADPKLLGKAVWHHAESRGATFRKAQVKELSLAGEHPLLLLEDGGSIAAGRLLIAAGAWSHRLARFAGDRVPLETERGYNTTLPKDAFDLRRQLIFSRHGFVVTPLETGLRVGGAVELAGLDRPPNFARADAMLKKAASFMPGLKTEGGRQWMGYRPSLPDSLPVIGRSTASPRVFYAFGHGHLGLTQAAATGRLLRDLVCAQPPAIDLAPFRAQRF